MSSRRERRKKLYAPAKEAQHVIQPRAQNISLHNRSGRADEIRTISPRAFKIIVTAVIIIVLLLLTAPKPAVPPGPLGEALGAQTQKSPKPLELNNLKTTIPPVNTSTGSALGETLKGKLKIN